MTQWDIGLLGFAVGWFGGGIAGSLLYAWISTPKLVMYGRDNNE